MSTRKNVLFRVDSGMFRCMNLAEFFDEQEWRIIWATRNFDNNMIDKIPKSHHVIKLNLDNNWKVSNLTSTWLGSTVENDIQQIISGLDSLMIDSLDLVIVDQYAIGALWEAQFKASINVRRLAVIDDLCDRYHVCDFIIDGTYRPKSEGNPYVIKKLVPKTCVSMVGSRYLPMNKRFEDVLFSGRIDRRFRINISFGGADVYNMTANVLE